MFTRSLRLVITLFYSIQDVLLRKFGEDGIPTLIFRTEKQLVISDYFERGKSVVLLEMYKLIHQGERSGKTEKTNIKT